jgi:hypothetical protein
MRASLDTDAGTVIPGTRLRITSVYTAAPLSAAFPDGVDHHAKDMEGREGEVTHIDDGGQLHGTWGGLALIPGVDRFVIL